MMENLIADVLIYNSVYNNADETERKKINENKLAHGIVLIRSCDWFENAGSVFFKYCSAIGY